MLGDVPKYSKDGNITWDESAQCNVYRYTGENGTEVTAYVEDLESLALKYEYTKTGGFKGIGIWALGQDAGMEEGAYDLIRKNFDTTYDGSGIEGNNRASDNISIFPVPVQDQLNVRTASDSSFATVNIYNWSLAKRFLLRVVR